MEILEPMRPYPRALIELPHAKKSKIDMQDPYLAFDMIESEEPSLAAWRIDS
jgi:hypothetical protein